MHARAALLGAAVYLLLVLAGVAGLATADGGFARELRDQAASTPAYQAGVALAAAWYALRAHLRRRRPWSSREAAGSVSDRSRR